MNDETYIQSYLTETKIIADEIDGNEIAKMISALRNVRRCGGRLFVLGVGGSAGNASHAVNDFRKIGGIECYAPTDNVSELTARTNDDGWASTFTEWLKTSQINEKDAIMVLSVGGGSHHTSLNIKEAVDLAMMRSSKVLGIVSRDGGFTKKNADACVLIPVVNDSRTTPHAEGWQGIVWHLVVNALDI